MRLNLTAVSSPSPIHCQLEKMIATHVSKPKKVDKKKRRCLAIIKADYNVTESETPTIFLAILNAGLCNGLTEETLLAKATAHGKVSQVLMLASKSYCFLKCASIADAESIFLAMHNVSTIGQHGAVCYLSYVTGIPQLEAVENDWNKPLPKGLILLTDFITEEEESALLKAIGNDSRSNEGNMKNRRVKHFGYEFVYGSNNVDSTKPLECRIPTACDFLWPRFRQAAAENDLQGLDWTQPDQLTVNEYEPGHGIPPHVDTHSAFLDPILSLSLESDVVMEFRRGSECTPLLLLRRSLLVMSGEARFDWMHGIRPRHLDWLPTATVSLTMEPRRKRTSLTFRRLRRGPCHCQFPTLCDTHQSTAPKLLMDTLAKQAVSLEQQNVHDVYNKIANHFSDTRHTPWPKVSDFLHSFDPQSIVLDVGCGNGKYLCCNSQLLAIGCDRSQGLLGVCNSRQQSVFRCDCLQLPIRTASMDGCISIAVIHHLANSERRLTALREMARILRPGGRALVYVWAKEQRRDNNKSSYLRQNKAVNKERTTEQAQRQHQAAQLEHKINPPHVSLPVHTNRTEFQQQDVFVPWKTKDAEHTTFLRYYHVFEEQELERLIADVPEVFLIKSYYDQGNHCVIFERAVS